MSVGASVDCFDKFVAVINPVVADSVFYHMVKRITNYLRK